MLTAGAAALGKPVNVFLQYWALDAFRAIASTRPRARPRGRRGGPRHVDDLRRAGQVSWAETLRQAKDLGEVDIQACSLSMDLLGIDEPTSTRSSTAWRASPPSTSTPARGTSSSSSRCHVAGGATP